MPVPIQLVNGPTEKIKSDGLLDISFLANHMPKEASGLSYGVTDSDADNVMNIWLNAKKIDNETFEIKSMDIDNQTIIRLKSRGLISGGTDNVKFTSRGKGIVKTMSLGESNNFLNKKKEKSYTEILASMDKRGKKGYRIAADGVYSEYSHLLTMAAHISDLDKMLMLAKLMKDLKKHFPNGKIETSSNYHSFEMMDEAMGTCWIAISYDKWNQELYIDKYYESEYLNNQNAKNTRIPCEFENYDSMKNNAIAAMEQMKNS